MASIFSLDKQVASLPKHGFPLSQIFDFTSSCGHILPVYFDQLNPGEKIRFSCDLFTRTQPLSSPANVDIDEYVDLFFVPLRKISAVADNILFQISDIPSSNFEQSTGSLIPATDLVFPVLDLSELAVPSDGSANAFLGLWTGSLSVYGTWNNFFESFYSGAIRLFDHLGVDPHVLLQGDASVYEPSISPAAFAVYQAIYYDYFRLSNWENNDILAYNLDKAYTSMSLLGTGMPWSSNYRLRGLLSLRYRAKSKDYFTNVFPSPLISQTGILTDGITNLTNVNQWLVSGGYNAIDPSGTLNALGSGTSVSPVPTSSYYPSNQRVLSSSASIRTLFAVDKLLKITGRAGKHYDDQVLAHFGFKVPQGFSNEVVHLGSHHQQIHIGEVISTASTSEGNLGELAGKGYGKGNSRLCDSFTAPSHGFIMAVYSCAPRVSYVGGLERLHTCVNRYDWFIPALDNLGMQPLYNFENLIYNYGSLQRYAWQLRYSQNKMKYNRASYAFLTRTDSAGSILNDGPFADWVITDLYQHRLTSTPIHFANLLVTPRALNEVMLVGYDPTIPREVVGDAPERIYASDPLIHHLVMTVSKVSGMSVYGLDDKAI